MVGQLYGITPQSRYYVDCDCIYRGGGEGREKRKVKEGERMGTERMEKRKERERGGRERHACQQYLHLIYINVYIQSLVYSMFHNNNLI